VPPRPPYTSPCAHTKYASYTPTWTLLHVSAIKHHSHGDISVRQWFPTFFFFNLRTPWQPISINCTLHISSATRHNVQLISHMLSCILSYIVGVCAFFSHYSIFFFAYPYMSLFVPLGVRVPEVGSNWCKGIHNIKTSLSSAQSVNFN